MAWNARKEDRWYVDGPTETSSHRTWHKQHHLSLLQPAKFDMGNAIGFVTGLSAASWSLLRVDILGASGLVNSISLDPHNAVRDPCSFYKLAFLSSFSLFSTLVLSDWDKTPAFPRSTRMAICWRDSLLALVPVSATVALDGACDPSRPPRPS